MGAVADAFVAAFRDFNTDGNPGTGAFNPEKSPIRALGAAIESAIAAQSNVPTGAMLFWPDDSTPTGYLRCDGSAVSRTTYAALYAVIGDTWGDGDGSTTFELPDGTRRFPLGAGGTGSDVIGDAVGDYGGSESVTLVRGHLPDFALLSGIGALTDHAAIYGTSTDGAPGSATAVYDGVGISPNRQHLTEPLGSGGPHNNMPPAMVGHWIIKT